MNGRTLDYPKPRYPMPIMMDESHFAWTDADNEPGISEKLLGQFTERRNEAAFVKLAKGATHSLQSRSVYFCKSGKGKIGSEDIRFCSTIHLEDGEMASVTASEDMVFVRMGLPDLSGLEMNKPQTATAMAAE